MRVAVTAPLPQAWRQRLEEAHPDVEFLWVSEKELPSHPRAGEVEVLVAYGWRVDRGLLESLPRLKWIQALSAGVDTLPLDDLRARGIILTNARGVHGIPIREYAVGVLLAHARRIPFFWEKQREAHWETGMRTDELYGQRVTVLGTGAIGRAIGEALQFLGVEVVGVNRRGTPVEPFARIYPASSVKEAVAGSFGVVNILPLTKATRNLLNRDIFSAFSPGSVFVNVGRGETVVEEDLLWALDEGPLAAAYLDVFREEPLPSDHPFWRHPKVFLTPHISGQTPRYMDRALPIFQQNLEPFRDGRLEAMINRVSLEEGY